MSKAMRFVDFQLSARPAGLSQEERKPLNETLFASYEPIRLWLKERAVQAPFKKIAITIADHESSAKWHGNVANAVGVCQVTEAVASSMIGDGVRDHRWVFAIVANALEHVAQKTGWKSEELQTFIESASRQSWPLVHYFDRLAKVDPASDMKCVPWLATRPGETKIGVRMSSENEGERDVAVVSHSGPIYLEDDFPMTQSIIRGSAFVLMDRNETPLATLPLRLQ
jgi:hypothetical protein